MFSRCQGTAFGRSVRGLEGHWRREADPFGPAVMLRHRRVSDCQTEPASETPAAFDWGHCGLVEGCSDRNGKRSGTVFGTVFVAIHPAIAPEALSYGHSLLTLSGRGLRRVTERASTLVGNCLHPKADEPRRAG